MRLIVCGDVHGCIEELDELLRTLEYRPTDRLVFLGDLVDRGPDPVGCVRRVKELGAQAIKGNHEVKHLRAWKRKPEVTFAKWPERILQHRALAAPAHDGQSLLDWIDTWPFFLRLEPNLVAVHAGFEPGKPVEEQSWEACVYSRYLNNDTGKRCKLTDDYVPGGPGQEKALPWTDFWQGEDVVYGHIVWSLSKVKQTARQRNPPDPLAWTWTWGIDTGCCFGGNLTAAVWDPTSAFPKIVQVKAKQRYSYLWYPPPDASDSESEPDRKG